MPEFLIYLLKLSISLAVVFLFYQFFLRRLTFYNWNRWYLLGYSVISFTIPVLDISGWLSGHASENGTIVQSIPVLESLAGGLPGASSNGLSLWDAALIIFGIGILLFVLRLSIILLSFYRLKSKAVLLSDDGTRLYRIDEQISPFSFGNSIFINPALHQESELREIIRHEFVHVRQRHTIDVLWAELLCLLNWYNPFAWLLRHAIRQNLEFIADRQVLHQGLDRKQYQYLLLKVVGNRQFSIAQSFNFSSLKKRIAMMNKNSSARVHLIRFLFLLPLMAVCLLAFRKAERVFHPAQDEMKVAGLVKTVEGESVKNLGIIIRSEGHPDAPAIQLTTDGNGFYATSLSKDYLNTTLRINFGKTEFGASFGTKNNKADNKVAFMILQLGDPSETVFQLSSKEMNGSRSDAQLFEEAESIYNSNHKDFYLREKVRKETVDLVVKREKTWYAFTANGGNVTTTISGNAAPAVWAEGKLLSVAEANSRYARNSFMGVGVSNGEKARQITGTGETVIYFYNGQNPFEEARSVQQTSKDTIPKVNEKGYSIVIGENKEHNIDMVIVYDRNKDFVQSFDRKEWNSALEKKYGSIPEQKPSKIEVKDVVLEDIAVPDSAQQPPKEVATVAIGKATKANGEIVVVGKPATAAAASKDVEAVTVTGYPSKAGVGKLSSAAIAQPDEIVVEGKPATSTETTELKEVTVVGYGKSSAEDTKIVLRGTKEEPLYILDGKPIESLEGIDAGTIESINVYKNENAIQKYGQKGKNGVVEIHTKKKEESAPKKDEKDKSISFSAKSIDFSPATNRIQLKGDAQLQVPNGPSFQADQIEFTKLNATKGR